MIEKLTHFDKKGDAIMVDVTDKTTTRREAVASGAIKVSPKIMELITQGTGAKGDILSVARIAGIMATKRTADLIPLCHPLMLDQATVEFTLDPDACLVTVFCTVKIEGKTGVEMEALTGVSVTLLTIYDMCKAVDKAMEIEGIRLLSKTGGKSGTYTGESDER